MMNLKTTTTNIEKSCTIFFFFFFFGGGGGGGSKEQFMHGTEINFDFSQPTSLCVFEISPKYRTHVAF